MIRGCLVLFADAFRDSSFAPRALWVVAFVDAFTCFVEAYSSSDGFHALVSRAPARVVKTGYVGSGVEAFPGILVDVATG